MLLGRAFHELGAEWVKDLCPYRTVLILGITSVREFCDLSVLLGVYIFRSGAVFKSEGSPSNPKDLLQIYAILAVGACVLRQLKHVVMYTKKKTDDKP